MADHGTFNWNELVTGDVERARTFFARVCGWTYDEVAFPAVTYTMARSGDRRVGGMMDKTKIGVPEMPDHWMAYIAMDDVDAAVAKVAGAGGTVLEPGFDVPNVGRIALVRDPGGAVIGLIAPS